jgi:hypothetical protein
VELAQGLVQLAKDAKTVWGIVTNPPMLTSNSVWARRGRKFLIIISVHKQE